MTTPEDYSERISRIENLGKHATKVTEKISANAKLMEHGITKNEESITLMNDLHRTIIEQEREISELCELMKK